MYLLEDFQNLKNAFRTLSYDRTYLRRYVKQNHLEEVSNVRTSSIKLLRRKIIQLPVPGTGTNEEKPLFTSFKKR